LPVPSLSSGLVFVIFFRLSLNLPSPSPHSR